MEYSESLKKTRDFQQVFRKGASAASRYFVMYALENGTGKNRLGISVSKKVGNSVVRHRVTRLVREGYRLQEQQFLRGWDIVMIARAPAAQCTQEEVKENLRFLGKKLHVREAV